MEKTRPRICRMKAQETTRFRPGIHAWRLRDSPWLRTDEKKKKKDWWNCRRWERMVAEKLQRASPWKRRSGGESRDWILNPNECDRDSRQSTFLWVEKNCVKIGSSFTFQLRRKKTELASLGQTNLWARLALIAKTASESFAPVISVTEFKKLFQRVVFLNLCKELQK